MQSHCGRLATPWMCIKPKGSLHLRGAPPMKSAKTWPRSVLGKRVSMVTADWRRKDESIESIMEAMRIDAVCRFIEPLSLREKVYSLGQNSCVLASTSELAETPPEKEQDNSTWVWNISGVLSVLTCFQNYSSLRSTCDTWSIFCQGNISNINININIHESSGLGQNTARLAESPVIPWFVPQTRVWTGQRVAVPPSFTRQFVQIFSYFLSTGSTVPSVIICMIVVYQFIMHLRHELLLQPVLAAEHETNQLTVKACKGGVPSALSDSFFDRRSLQDTARF